jgi:hypothetical protein
MKRLLLFLLLALFGCSPEAGITFVGSAGTPADGGTQDGRAMPVAITPPSNMQVNDYVIVVWHYWRSPHATIAVSNTGGQSWTSETQQDNNPTYFGARLFRCRFNGKWSASPSFNLSGTTTGDAFGGIMLVFRGVNTTSAFDVALRQGAFPPNDPVTIPAITTNNKGAMVVAIWVSSDDNTWSLQTSGWSQDAAQWRNVARASTSYAYKVVDASSSNNVSNRQVTLGDDGGYYYIFALKP